MMKIRKELWFGFSLMALILAAVLTIGKVVFDIESCRVVRDGS